MPPLPAAPNCLRVDFLFGIGSDHAAGSRLYFQYAGGPLTPAQATAIANAAQTAAAAQLPGVINANGSLEEIVVTDLSVLGGVQGINATGVSGTRTGGELPSETAALFNYKIARTYRGGKPRSYFAWGAATDISAANLWTSGFTTAATTALTNLIAAISGFSGSGITMGAHVNVGYYSGVLPPTTLPSGRVKQANKVLASPHVDVITSLHLNPIPGSQRRRNVR